MPVTRSFDAFHDVRLNKRLSSQSGGWWFETLSCPLWRHCNAYEIYPISAISACKFPYGCQQMYWPIICRPSAVETTSKRNRKHGHWVCCTISPENICTCHIYWYIVQLVHEVFRPILRQEKAIFLQIESPAVFQHRLSEVSDKLAVWFEVVSCPVTDRVQSFDGCQYALQFRFQ